jgi:hypothetical protein
MMFLGLLAVIPLPGLAAEPVNLIANGDFAKAADGKPDGWQTAGNPKDVDQTLSVVPDTDGRLCAKLACTRCEKRSAGSHAMLAQGGQVRLVKDRTYRFSCRLRQEGIQSRLVSIALSDTKDWSNAGLQEQVAVGAAWKTYQRFFQATRDIGPTSRLQIWFLEPGTLYIAEVQIIEIDPAKIEFTDLAPPASGKNLLYNGSFEIGPSGWSSLGKDIGWGNLDHLHGQIQEAGGTHGRCFLRIPMGGDKAPLLHFDYYEPVTRRELRPLAASRGWIKVEPGAVYTLSCDMRASVEGTPAVMGARVKDPAARGWNDSTRPVALATAWTRYSLTFRPKSQFLFVFAGPDLPKDESVDVDIDAIQLEKGDKATDFAPANPVEVGVAPTEGPILEVTGSAPNSLVVRAFNGGAAPVQVALKFGVTDFEDRAAQLRPCTMTLESISGKKQNIELPGNWRGFYRIRPSVEIGGKAVDLPLLRLAIVPGQSEKDSVCGINHAFNSPYLIRLARQAGITWYRDWTLKWQHIEPAKGEFHWEIGDEQLGRVLEEGVQILPLLPPFPSADWTADAPASLPTEGYPGVRLRQAFPPKDPDEMGRFIEQAVARYKARIHLWEFLNEPVYTSYALPDRYSRQYGGKGYTPADYVALLKVAATAMRKADPTCKVMGGIAGNPEELTREVIEAGCLAQVDIFNLHMYPGQRPPENYIDGMDRLLEIMDKHGGRKPVWITEFSYYAADDLPRRPFFPQANFSEERLLESERQCADYTVRYFAVMLSHGVEKIFLHSGASGRVNDPNFECALFDYGGAPRKLVPALAVFTNLVGPKPSSAGFRRLGESGYAAAFETGKQAVVVAWSGQPEEKPVSIGLAPEAVKPTSSVTDIMGRQIPAASDMRLSGSPIYFIGPAGKARQMLEGLRVTGSSSASAPTK